MVKNAILPLILLVAPMVCAAQQLEFHSIRRLPSSINSAGEETLPMMSPDGSRLYFARALYAGNTGGKFSGTDVWHSEAKAGDWTTSTNTLPAAINNSGHNAIVGISKDGKKLYFLNARPGEKVNGIFVTSKINNVWTRPEAVLIPGIENQAFLGIHVSPDAEVILLSMKAPDSRGEEDLYFSVKSSTGQWSAPRNLGSTINTVGYEISPFLSSDGKRLYFSSNGHGGEGGADIFYSERLYNSWETWSAPVNLGKTVNSSKFDAYFSIYGDSIAYLASNRDGRYADLYEVDVAYSRTVLKAGQRYLSQADWRRALGGAVSNEVVFSGKGVSLSPAQQELLFYIANKLQLQKSILIHLVVTEEEDPALRPKRLEAARDYLVKSGIGEDRIIIEQAETPAKSSGGKIEVRLIE